MIEVKNLTKVYGKKQNKFIALKNVNFKIPDGTTVAITGKSGSGKSTLTHIMSGLDHPSDGCVIINGHTLHKLNRKAMDGFRAKGMGFIFQAFFVEPNQTSYQNIALPMEIAGIPRSERRAKVEAALKAVELSEKIDEKARNLSGGQKQRLAIARAIVNKPKLIFADEPTGNLDSATGDKIMKLLFDLNKDIGSTLVIVTHDQDLAAKCQIQINLKDGAIISSTDKKAKPQESARRAPSKRLVRKI
jgi:putative ABC transport system ATP-binding protein